MFKKPKLAIIRGLPGSGKSFYAKKLSKQFNIKHFENDAYLYVNGEYKWTPITAKLAAKKCFEDTMNELKAGRNAIVSNVFVTKGAIDKYVNTAKHIGASVMIIRMTNDFGNIHNVPQDTLTSMKKGFQNYPGEIFK